MRIAKLALALAILIGVIGCSGNTEDIAATVAQSMEETLNTEQYRPYRLHVVKVDIIKSSGNAYKGMARCGQRGALSVTCRLRLPLMVGG